MVMTHGSVGVLVADLAPGMDPLAVQVLDTDPAGLADTVLGSGIGLDAGAGRVCKSDPAYDSSLASDYEQVEEPAWDAAAVAVVAQAWMA